MTVSDGLRAGSGFLAGLLGGAIGGAIAIAVSKTDSVVTADTNVMYLAVFGSYGAVLGAVILATNAATRAPRTVIGWLLGGAMLGGGVGGLGSLGLIRAIVQQVLDESRDPEKAFVVAVAIVFGSLGLCIGVALGAVRGGGAAITSGIAGGVAGAIGGAAYVQIVLFSDSIRSARAAENIAIATLACIGAVIGFAIGAMSPPVASTSAAGGSYAPGRTNALPPAMPMPVVPWGYPSIDIPGIDLQAVVAPVLPPPPVFAAPSLPAPPPAPAPVVEAPPPLPAPPPAPAPVVEAPAPPPPPAPVVEAPAPVAEPAPALPVPTPPRLVEIRPPSAPVLLVDIPAEPLVAHPPPLPAPVVEAPPAPVQRVRPPARYALRLDDGRTVAIDGRVIVGRDPQGLRRDDADAVLVSIEDPGHTVSPTHMAVTDQDDRLFVEDRGSVSGSTVVSPAGVTTRLEHATPVQVGDGWLVLFGARRAHVSKL